MIISDQEDILSASRADLKIKKVYVIRAILGGSIWTMDYGQNGWAFNCLL